MSWVRLHATTQHMMMTSHFRMVSLLFCGPKLSIIPIVISAICLLEDYAQKNLTTAECISRRLLSPIFLEQMGWNWTCPCVEDNHPLRVAPAGGTDLTRPDHPKQRGPCGRKHAFCGVIPPVNCLNNSGCGYTLQMNYGVNGLLTTSPTIGYISSRTTDTTITFLSN